MTRRRPLHHRREQHAQQAQAQGGEQVGQGGGEAEHPEDPPLARPETSQHVDGLGIDLAQALRRAEAAHGEHEKRTGKRDENWPEWYAAYMVAEQSGNELPQ